MSAGGYNQGNLNYYYYCIYADETAVVILFPKEICIPTYRSL